ncbi:hypothetical protein PHISCL_08163 [Aspergillus sclerotialis]|uniref:Ubiquitin-conjugating enzyme E2-binding protein n=1 Tax=Aspergillus sclerotialis TaxID=2070753 RepID=A0A3A2ZQY8_9EURO|nr:hypothetical protein PHISCL_08163 [Aspergillus sclerotialis]
MTVPQPLSTTQVDVQDSVQTAPQQINLHAEYLPNIRQVTLYISLSESSDSRLSELQPEIHLSESRRAITVAYPAPFEDVSETIKLPSRVSEAARAALEKQMRVKRGDEGTGLDEHGREFSFRMQIDASEVLAGEEVVDAFVPWTAGDMSHTTKVRCRECEGVILNSPAGSPSDGNGGDDGTGAGTPGWIWKDLPSENWAEMMDFWHCHKPDPHEGDLDGRDHAHSQDANRAKTPEDPNAQVKGYGAANRVVATSGTVLVDVSSFLVSEVDCLGLKKVRFSRLPLLCSAWSFNPFCHSSLESLISDGQQEGDLAIPWLGHRYNCPRPTSFMNVSWIMNAIADEAEQHGCSYPL